LKAPAFEYHAPRELGHALELLARLDGARVLAGGQSLMPMLNLRLASPRHLIDLNRIAQLSGMREEGDALVLGAMTRQRDIEFSDLVARRLPLFAEAIRSVGHRQTRNRGTLGGSLCHLDPAAELPVACMAMDAMVRVQSRRGRREIPMRSFPAGLMTTALEPDEILTEVLVRPWTGRVGTAFVEYARRHGDFAVACVAVLVELDARTRVVRAVLTVGGVGQGPMRIEEAERAMIGRALDDASITDAAAAFRQVDAMSDAFFPGWYRRQVAHTLAQRALRLALERARS
jgi:carbon-monoxide dehydrogenase medium subunit